MRGKKLYIGKDYPDVKNKSFAKDFGGPYSKKKRFYRGNGSYFESEELHHENFKEYELPTNREPDVPDIPESSAIQPQAEFDPFPRVFNDGGFQSPIPRPEVGVREEEVAPVNRYINVILTPITGDVDVEPDDSGNRIFKIQVFSSQPNTKWNIQGSKVFSQSGANTDKTATITIDESEEGDEYWYVDATSIESGGLSPVTSQASIFVESTAEPHKYWRLDITADNDPNASFDRVIIAEIEFMNVVGGSDLFDTESATASAQSEATPASDAIDNNVSSYWFNGLGDSLPTWWKAEFTDNDFNIVQYTIKARGGSFVQPPKDWNLQWSDDDSSWTTVDTQTGITWTGSEKKTFTV